MRESRLVAANLSLSEFEKLKLRATENIMLDFDSYAKKAEL